MDKMKIIKLETLDHKTENDLTFIYDAFYYKHPFIDPDVIGPIVKNSFNPFLFNTKPVLYLIIESGADGSIDGYFPSYLSTSLSVLNTITVYYPFVVNSERLLAEVLEKLCNVKYSFEIIPLLDNPYMSVIMSSVCNFEKKIKIRVVSYNQHSDKVARTRVRKAQNNGLIYQILMADEMKRPVIRDFLKCASESIKRRGRIIEVSEILVDKWYRTLKSISEKDKGIFIAIYNRNGNLVGGEYILINEKIMYHYISYNSNEGLKMQAGYFSLNAAYGVAKEKNLIVDFGLNPVNEPFVEYKKHWGEYRVEYSYAKSTWFYKSSIDASA